MSHFRCLMCKLEFPSSDDKRRHLLEKHPDDLLFCSSCNKPFAQERSLQYHLKVYHPELLHKCSFCERTFALEDALHFHLDQSHEDQLTNLVKPHICPVPYCQKRFQKLPYIGLHLLLHRKESLEGVDLDKFPYDSKLAKHLDYPKVITNQTAEEVSDVKIVDDKIQCAVCGKLVSPGGLPIHMIRHNEPKFPCLICAKKFRSPSKLKDHNLQFHINTVFSCPELHCEKIFKRRYSLKRHILGVHKQRQQYPCDICEKTFSIQYDLAAHIKALHRGIKELCSVCGKSFNRVSERNRHERDTHGFKRI